MRRIEFDPDKLDQDDRTWWEDWVKRATAVTTRHVAAWEAWHVATMSAAVGTGAHSAQANSPPAPRPARPSFKDEIWSEFKARLLKKVFGNKCAYCETANPVRWPVEVEHYRPKGDVGYRDANGSIAKARARDSTETEVEHPGYFWLAYNWRNLLPCCKRCNSGKGKNTQFPTAKGHMLLRKLTSANADAMKRATPSVTWKGWYYPAPEDLDEDEQPLLINPYLEDPAAHIAFGIKGMAASKTEKGENSIKVFDLSDEDLREARQKAQETGLLSYMMLVHAFKQTANDPLDVARQKALEKMSTDRRALEYSAAVFDALPVLWKQMAPAD